MASVLRDDYDDGYGLLFSLSRRLSMANGLTSSGLSWADDLIGFYGPMNVMSENILRSETLAVRIIAWRSWRF